MISQEKVSIIIPVYNRPEKIKEAITSIQLQTHSNFECLIVDDHSLDHTFEIIRDSTKDDNRFRLLKRKSALKGASVCRNEGIQEASGKYIMFLDSDDLLSPICFEQRIKFFKNYPEADFIVSQVGIFDNSTYLVDRIWSSLSNQNDIEAFVNSKGWCISNTFFKRSFIKKYRFDTNAQSWQDIEFHMRLLLDKPNYVKNEDAEPDAFIRFSDTIRISNTNTKFARIKSRIQLLIGLEKKLIERNVSYKSSFLIYYFKFIEIASRTCTFPKFKYLIILWSKSETHHTFSGHIFKSYLYLQAYLTNINFYSFGSIFYRLIRLFISEDLLYARSRSVKMRNPIDIKKLLKKYDQ